MIHTGKLSKLLYIIPIANANDAAIRRGQDQANVIQPSSIDMKGKAREKSTGGDDVSKDGGHPASASGMNRDRIGKTCGT